jgi:hypothetical protein
LPKNETVAKANRTVLNGKTVGAQRVSLLTKGAPSSQKLFQKSIGERSQILQDDETEEPSPTRRPTRTPRSTPTPRVSTEATPEVVGGFTFTLPPASADYREERWYAMTLGIIVSAAVISVGAIINIIRSILRRRR